MPIYEYTCDDCGNEFELLIRGQEKPECPSCNSGKLSRSLSVTAAPRSGSAEPACPAKNSCEMKHCCGNNCGMGQWG